MEHPNIPDRKRFDHVPPFWVDDQDVFFVTVCCRERGKNSLCKEEVFSLLKNSLLHYESKGWLRVVQFLAMPDHVHFLASFDLSVGLTKPMACWKSYTAKQGNFYWQGDYFDHRLRSDESWLEKARYIRANPVRAGLIESEESWPFIWERPGIDW